MKDKWIKFSFEDDEYYYVKASKIAAIRGKEGGVSTVLFGKEFDSWSQSRLRGNDGA